MYKVQVPAELWAEIFIRCLPQDLQRVDMLSCFDSRDPPLVLTAICREWRRIALSTPMLWTVIYYIPAGGKGRSLPDSRDAQNHYEQLDRTQVSTWITRSGHCPLRIRVGSWGTFSPAPAMQLLALSSPRWKEAHLAFHHYGDDATCELRSIHGNLSSLKTLSLSLDFFLLSSIDISPISLFEAAPQLRNVEVSGVSSLSMPHMAALPWSQLSSYRFSGRQSLETCFDVLSKCTNVEDYSLAYSFFLVSSPELTPITHTKLRSISIVSDVERVADPEGELLASVLDHLTLPSLKELTICTSLKWPHTQFLTFLSRVCHITTLAFHCNHLTDVDLIEILKTTTGLVRLSLTEEFRPSSLSGSPTATITQTVLSELTITGESVDLLPALESISLDGGHFDGLSYLAMIESRWQRDLGFALRGAVVWINYGWPHSVIFDDSVIIRLGELKGDGLDIRVFEGREQDTSQDTIV